MKASVRKAVDDISNHVGDQPRNGVWIDGFFSFTEPDEDGVIWENFPMELSGITEELNPVHFTIRWQHSTEVRGPKL